MTKAPHSCSKAGDEPADEMEDLVTKVALEIGAFEREETDETATDFARRLVAFFVGYFGQTHGK